MVSKIKKVPFPDFLLKTPCTLFLESTDVTADGEQETVIIKNQKCIFDEKSRRTLTKDGKETISTALVILKGDVAPDLSDISSGTIKIFDRKLTISKASRPRNPDGTVHHTEFEVM